MPIKWYCQAKDEETQSQCGRPQFTNHSGFCEKHFADKYPLTYERLKREIQCPNCQGVKDRECSVCYGAGWVDTKRTKIPTPQPPMSAHEAVQAFKVFDPPAEKAQDFKE